MQVRLIEEEITTQEMDRRLDLYNLSVLQAKQCGYTGNKLLRFKAENARFLGLNDKCLKVI